MKLGRTLANLAVCLPALAASQSPTPRFLAPAHYWSVFGGASVTVLGSEQVRLGGGLSYAYARPDKRWTFDGARAQQVLEVYLDQTFLKRDYHSRSNAVGFLIYGRYRGSSAYFDAGIGLQVQSRTSDDVPTYVNSTPILGGGAIIHTQGHDYLIGARWLHVSNARTKNPDPGQNEIFLTFSVRY